MLTPTIVWFVKALLHKKANYAGLLLLIVANFAPTGSIVSISPPSPVLLGSTTTLYCNLTNELVNGFSWLRYNGSVSTTLNLGTIVSVNTPSRYSIQVVTRNSSTLSYSTLTINGVLADDFTTFECLGSSSSKINLTQLILTTTTIAPVRCLLDNYNYALYIMIMLSNVALGITVIGIYQFISAPKNYQLLLLFGVLLSAVILVVIMILFWISPNFVSGDSQVWSPVVIISCGYGSLVLLWIVNLIFLGIVFHSENIIEIPVLVIIVINCVVQLALIGAVLTGVGYCTNTTSLARYTTDPQIVNVVLGGVILFLCLVVLALMLWKYKGKKQIISIQSAAYNNVRDHSILSGFVGVRSAPSENLSPTSLKNGKDSLDAPKTNKNQLPLIPLPNNKSEKEKNKDKTKSNDKEAEKMKEKGTKVDEKKKEDERKKSKLPELHSTAKSPDTSFGSMDFDQNDLRRSTPNAEDVENAPKTTNPLLMNFIKNTNEQAVNQKNLEAIQEESPDSKNKTTPKTTPKATPKTSKNKDDTGSKDSGRKEKKEKKSDEKGLKKKNDEGGNDADSLNGDKGSENMFPIEPISDRKPDDDDKKKSKKAGKGKTKSKE